MSEIKNVTEDEIPQWAKFVSSLVDKRNDKSLKQTENYIVEAPKEQKNNPKAPGKRAGMYSLLLSRLSQLEKSGNSKIIRFPVLFENICRNFSITKKQCWELLFLLAEFGLIKIVPFQGVKILWNSDTFAFSQTSSLTEP